MKSFRKLTILVLGAYLSEDEIQSEINRSNVLLMEQTALNIFQLGYLPIIGQWLLLNQLNKKNKVDHLLEILAEELLDKCDALIRVENISPMADRIMELAKAKDKLMFNKIDDIKIFTK